MGAERGHQATTVRDSTNEVQSRSARRRAPEAHEAPAQATGNIATARALSRFGIHPKLSISQPGDPEEEEADRVANAVVGRTTVPTVERKCACSGGTPCAACDEKIHA